MGGGLKVEVTKDQMKINNEVVEPSTVTDLYMAYAVPNGMLVQINYLMAIKVTDKGIGIEVHTAYKGNLCGICSNYDGLTSMKESCFSYEYDVKEEGDYTCTSTVPISTCKAGCTSALPYNSNVMYDCVASDDSANRKQDFDNLPSFPKPGCHYYRKWWMVNSEGCQA